MAGELAAEWIRIPDGNGNLRKVWIRDSQARRDIAQLQTDVSGKADAATTLAGYGITDAYTKTQVDGMIPSVPSAYTSNPEMDGTASPGSSTAWARGDHVHPHDSTKADASAIPTKTSDLTNDSGFITSAPVTSVNGQTGAVVLTASDVGALPDTTVIPSKTSDLTNDSGFISSSTLQPTAYTAFTPYQSRCTVDAGGYVKVGNIVFIDMVITVLQAAGTSAFVAMLSDVSAIKPLKGANYSILTAVNNTSRTKTTKVLVNTNGGISLCNAAVNEVVYITGCYLAAA